MDSERLPRGLAAGNIDQANHAGSINIYTGNNRPGL
jgi:hypothetical protein